MMRFEENEYIMMAMFQRENRLQTMGEIRGILPFVKDDGEISALDLEPYRQEPVEE